MMPRLPPVVLAAMAGAAIYGAKHVLDRLEPKAIGPPGSSEHAEKVLKYRQNVKKAGIASAILGFAWVGYWAYESRQNRSSPSVTVKNHTDDDYQDQYSVRDKYYTIEKERLKKQERHLENKKEREVIEKAT
ncbi:hypothetical protein BY458DRAFT_511100 [Sporodiniella umbellata]|nr:hypothetical protein BY458DRAFT_511100 [Sporodiniella umbellata]